MLKTDPDGAKAGDAVGFLSQKAGRVMKVCLVEDDRELRESLAEVFGRAGYETQSASDGTKAMPLLRDWQPDIVVCDMIMPNSEGFEVLRNARSIVPEARFVMISGATGEILDVLEAARLLGADAILRKPFQPTELLDILASFQDAAPDTVRESGADSN